jgi:Tetracyclin repressor-like, C-terminal domain
VRYSGVGAPRNFWAMRSRPIAEILGRHQTRPCVGDVALVHQMLVAPLHMRILLTGEPIDGDFLAAVVDTVIRGVPRTTC